MEAFEHQPQNIETDLPTGNEPKYFYMSTIKQSTAVTECIRANFTWSPISIKDLQSKQVQVSS